MNKFSMKKLLSILLCIALIAALALSTVGCSKNDNTAPAPTAEASAVVSTISPHAQVTVLVCIPGCASMGVKETVFSLSSPCSQNV